MPREPVHFTLTDADGTAHEYTVVPHPGTSGRRIVMKLAGMAAPALGEAAKALAAGMAEAAATDAAVEAQAGPAAIGKLLDTEIGKVLGSVDFGRIGEHIAQAAGEFDDRLFAELFSLTSRGGVPLDKSAAFDAAYTANYVEMFKAVGKIIQINRFFPLPGTN